jgi:UDP-glucose 4-epimerase
MRVFVTGGAGYIGSVVVERLISEGHEVAVFDNLRTGHRAAVDPSAELIVGEILDLGALELALMSFQPEAVFHLAAEIAVGESVLDPGLHYRVNLGGTLNLLQAMAAKEVGKLIFSSTAAVYGDPERLPLDEGHPLNPVSPYGETKRAAEAAISSFCTAHGLSAVSFRYFNACGATERNGEWRANETHIIPVLFEVLEGKRGQFTLFGTDYDTEDGTCIRDYVHIADIADAHLLGLKQLEAGHHSIFNLGTAQPYSNLQVIQAVERVTGQKIPWAPGQRRAGDAPVLVADASRFSTVAGWKPKFVDIESMVESAWQWRLGHPGGYSS